MTVWLQKFPCRWLNVVWIVLSMGLSGGASAQAFPTKPVHVIVPFPPGVGPDLVIRSISEELSARWGQPLVVENKPGVGGLLAGAAVARSQPDGHTLLMAPNTLVISPHVLPPSANAGLDVIRDLAPVISPATSPMLLLAHPDLGVKTVQDLLPLMRRTPGIAYGSAGNGSPMHIAGVLFTRAAGVQALHVPYRGAAPALVGALAGDVKLLFAVYNSVRPHIDSGRLIPLAVVESKRTPFLPHVPTMAEQGLSGVEVNAWYGMFAPAATPQALVQRINHDVNEVLKLPKIKARFQEVGLDMGGGTTDSLVQTVRRDHGKYGEIAKSNQISAD